MRNLLVLPIVVALVSYGCGESETGGDGGGTGGAVTTGGTGNPSGTGGAAGTVGSGGMSGMGGSTGTGGATATGSGGASATGSGGATAAGSCGATGSGGVRGAGGATGSGGATGVAGAKGSGGAAGSGGASGTGGGGAAGSGAAGATGGGGTSGGRGGATGGSGGVAGSAGTTPAPDSVHCVNWADQRDNFVNGLLQPSGLNSATDTYATVQAKANAILSAFQQDLQANGIRIPINEPTASSTWWAAYRGIIDAATAKGMTVMIGYWAYHNGKPDSTTAFTAMWKVVVDAYQANPLVFFDIHNEPWGLSAPAWLTMAENWLTAFPNVPRDRIVVAGAYSDQDLNSVGSDAKLAGTILSLHVYTFYDTSIVTAAGWESYVKTGLSSYASRTVVTEWGAPMTTGTNYAVTTDGNADIAYMNGAPNQMRSAKVGSCYWPGLRIGDSWSATTLNGTGTNLSLSVTNASGLARIHWAWGL
jgi:hypothetical protein